MGMAAGKKKSKDTYLCALKVPGQRWDTVAESCCARSTEGASAERARSEVFTGSCAHADVVKNSKEK